MEKQTVPTTKTHSSYTRVLDVVGGSDVESNLKLDIDPILIIDEDLSAISTLHEGHNTTKSGCVDNPTTSASRESLQIMPFTGPQLTMGRRASTLDSRLSAKFAHPPSPADDRST